MLGKKIVRDCVIGSYPVGLIALIFLHRYFAAITKLLGYIVRHALIAPIFISGIGITKRINFMALRGKGEHTTIMAYLPFF